MQRSTLHEQPELAAKFRVMSIPTLAVFNKGEIVKTAVGAKQKQDIISHAECYNRFFTIYQIGKIQIE